MPQTETSQNYFKAEVVKRDALLSKVAELQPLLQKNAALVDQSRKICDENLQALTDAGLFRMTIPKRYGGYECSIQTTVDVLSFIAEGCGSSGWVAAVISAGNWSAALYTQQSQDDVFGANANARVVGVATPSTEVKRVDGGLIVSGKWYSCSGCLHSDWVGVGVLELDESGAPKDHYLGLVPIDELKIEDTWYVAGMKGTGSNCVVAENIFIPEHRLLSLICAGKNEYLTEHTQEIPYRALFGPASVAIMAASLLGLGRAALKLVIEKSPQKGIAYTTYFKQTNSTAFQLQVVQASQKIDIANMLVRRATSDIDNAALSDIQLDALASARVNADLGLAAETITDAINLLMTAHGSGAFADSNTLQRLWRDANTAARHAILLRTVSDEIYGKLLLGLENTVTPSL